MRSTSASNSSPPSVGVSKSRTDPVSHIRVFLVHSSGTTEN
jgi:hypothetical protein